MSDKRVEITGNVSGFFESGGRGVKTVSTGKGDNGGVSYGKHQLASNNGSMALFLESPFGAPYRAQFSGLKPGTAAFTSVYTKIANETPTAFERDQFQYIAASHYDPQAAKLKAEGINVDDRHVAVRECVFSVAVQYGRNTSIIIKALGSNFRGSDKDFIEKVQDYRGATVNTYFKSSSQQTRDSVKNRSQQEKQMLLKLLNS